MSALRILHLDPPPAAILLLVPPLTVPFAGGFSPSFFHHYFPHKKIK
jgi:hypothetical protein